MCPMQEGALSALIVYLPKEKLPARYAATGAPIFCIVSYASVFVHVLFTFFRGNTICIAAANRV